MDRSGRLTSEPVGLLLRRNDSTPVADHWAFRVPKRPDIPVVKNVDWVRNPIDAFLAAEHAKRNLVPQPEADKRTLLRRAYVDLIGVPPSRRNRPVSGRQLTQRI